MHGGLFSEDGVTLDDLRKIERNRQPPDSGRLRLQMHQIQVSPERMTATLCSAPLQVPCVTSSGRIHSLRSVPTHLAAHNGSSLQRTSDWINSSSLRPSLQNGRSVSKRGVSCQFGPDVTERFLEQNKLDFIVRSHEVKAEGYEVTHSGKCITVFSAPNYWYVMRPANFWRVGLPTRSTLNTMRCILVLLQ